MITEGKLIKAKEELLQMCNTSEKKIIIEGSNPLLLGANIINRNNPEKIRWISRLNNDDNTFATLVYLLSKETGCHSIIRLIDTDSNIEFNDLMALEKAARVSGYINNQMIREYTLKHNIQAIINHLIYYNTNHRDIEVFEYCSSFNFGGLTGFSQILDTIAEKNNMTVQLGYTTTPSKGEFDLYGYKFSDEVICRYKEFIKLGILTNKDLCREQIWPRSLEIIGISEFRNDFDKLADLANIEIEFINEVIKDLKDNGQHKALTYKK